jgi:hypothetical protein
MEEEYARDKHAWIICAFVYVCLCVYDVYIYIYIYIYICTHTCTGMAQELPASYCMNKHASIFMYRYIKQVGTDE